MFEGPLTESILARAQENGLLSLHFHDLRSFADPGGYKQVDDRPYGGGAGMVMMCEPLTKAIEAVTLEGKKVLPSVDPYRIFFSPAGRTLTQSFVEKTAKRCPWLLLLCGHYEGIDQRILDGGWIDEEVSIGDYVLTGGELPAMVFIDAVSRHIPGVLGKDESAQEESFSPSLGRKREYPQYTRPEEFQGLSVPKILLSGDHAKIRAWRRAHLR